jgi:hypothetical protein
MILSKAFAKERIVGMNIRQTVSSFVAINLLAGTFIFAASTGADAQQFKRITTEQEYRETLVGKRLVNENGGWVRATNAGKMEGEFGGKKLVGVWQWNSGYLCRNARLGGDEIGSDCVVIEVGGNMSRATSKQGQGNVVIYRIE